MFKFFKNIRYNMVGQSRFGRYFIYAFGEIFLVVIGILIALYVNDWNQNRQLKIEEQQSLVFLKAELEGNLQKFDYKYNNQKIRKEAINRILFQDLSKADLPELDSIYQMSFYSWTFVPSFSVKIL